MYSLERLFSFAIEVYILMIVARAVISWIRVNPYSPIIQTLYKLTEPVLYPIRKALFKYTGNVGIDFSPFVAIILLSILRSVVARLFLYFY